MLSVYQLNDINEIASEMITHMHQQIKNPSLKDSKFEFDSEIRMDVDFHRLNLTRGSSYLPLPEWLSRKGAIINPKNNDMECFKWSVIAATKWEEIGDHPERISKLKRYEDDFDWDNVKFPVSFRDINRFESGNEIAINVLSYEDKEIYICRKGKEYVPRRTGEEPRIANLMIIRDHNRRHYVVIKSLSRLLSRQNSKRNGSQHFCTNCLQGFKEVETRDEHSIYCRNNEAVKIEMPKK